MLYMNNFEYFYDNNAINFSLFSNTGLVPIPDLMWRKTTWVTIVQLHVIQTLLSNHSYHFNTHLLSSPFPITQRQQYSTKQSTSRTQYFHRDRLIYFRRNGLHYRWYSLASALRAWTDGATSLLVDDIIWQGCTTIGVGIHSRQGESVSTKKKKPFLLRHPYFFLLSD